jgi:hypothetical protein
MIGSVAEPARLHVDIVVNNDNYSRCLPAAIETAR